MNILLDTTIVLNLVRAKKRAEVIHFVNPDDSLLYLSIVSEAEIRSLAIRKKWGTNRLDVLDHFLDQTQIIDVNHSSLNIYTQIDTCSQCASQEFVEYPFATPRNMGKNDLWIASPAALLNLTLITTDADFEHLHKVFFEVRKIAPAEFIPFF